MSLDSSSPAPAGPLVNPKYFFWVLLFAEMCLLAFLVSQFPQVRKQNTQFISLREQGRNQAGQAEQVQAQLQSLAGDLLQLADSDPQAQALAAKYQIRRAPGSR